MAILWCNTANESRFWIDLPANPDPGVSLPAENKLFWTPGTNGNRLTLLDITSCCCSLALHKPSSGSYLGNIV